MYHGWLVVLEAARPELLANLHIQHTGISKTLMDTCQLYFWPGTTNPIELMISGCAECTACLPSQTLEPQIKTEASRPFEKFSIVSIRTDGGPLFHSPCKTWCVKHHIRHELASAYNHVSNGHAECAVREVKKLLDKTPSYTVFCRVLRGYRNCPRYGGLSPA